MTATTAPARVPFRPPASRPLRGACALLAVLVPAVLVLAGAAAAQAPRRAAAEPTGSAAPQPPRRAVAPKAVAKPHDDPLLARVNDRELHLSDVHASIESLSLGDQIEVRDQIATYIEAVINEEVLFQWALRTDFAGEPELRKSIKDQVVRYLIEEHVRSRVHVTEADARAYYEANPSLVRGEHVRVRRILLAARPQCERLKAQIHSEEEFAAAARRYSLDDETRSEGGDVGLMMRGEGPRKGYELEFFKMRPGEMRIFDVPRGCMLVRSVYYVNPPLPPFSAVRDDLMQYLRNRQEVRLVDQLFRRASGSTRVERFYESAESPAAPAAAPPAAAGGSSR